MGKDYNQTINLPKTDFPMRASLPQREPELLKAWQENKTYEKLQELTEGRPLKVLHDGPPFSNGNIHMGTALDKVLKDFINRYNSMSGYHSPYIPGWDNHGMPIESAIIKMNKLDRKKMSIPEFRNACKDFAQKYVNKQMEQFVRLGVLGDWDNSYLTMNPSFEAREIKVFGEMYKKGYIYKGLKPVYWCPHDETALAEAEIEYQEDPCTSVYVKFAVKDDLGKLSQFGDLNKLFFVIWTTTIWTLPGNLAIALHPAENYVVIKAENGESYIMAEALTEKTMAMAGLAYEIVGSFKGRDFEYMKAQHPFLDRDSLVVNADYVTMDSGTGCVHTAPGFGADDYLTGKKYDLDILVPVDDRGYQTADAGKFAGLGYEESNKAIYDDLQATGALFASEKITHTYPHCWRCKNPIIFRATPQWFCSIDAIKDEAIKACGDVEWIPAWGGERIVGMIRERSDWCISRQRRWGLPIPVFYCAECGKPVCTEETIEKVSEVFGKDGSNAWYEKDVTELLPDGFTCPHCGGKHFTKEIDTLDGWFDSGSSHFAVLENKIKWPADIYLEGADQYRGWFQSSLLTAVAAKGEGAPYKTVLTHGWVVDGEGKKMSKSLGNTIDPLDVIKEYGADMLRLWVASSDYRVDVRVSKEIFKQLSQAYLKIRNTARYILGNLDGFDPRNLVKPEDMAELDKWAVTRLNQLIAKVIKGYEDYEYHIVYHSIRNFCVVDMSNFYLDVIKDRLYCEEKDGILRRSAQSAMYMILDAMVRMLAPILCFTADEIWNAMPHTDEDKCDNIAFNDMAKPYENYALSDERMAQWDDIISLRDDINAVLEEARASKLIGKPLEADIELYANGNTKKWLEGIAGMLKTLLIVSGVSVKENGEGTVCQNHQDISAKVFRAEGEKCERCWTYTSDIGSDPEHPTLCARCAAVVNKNL
ncbi:MAG: isoleucine--tRNA ligase [Clostridiaceae bacterium]|nr:isoleucine--tRNA ligase [Clostridiaceae bacterium]